MENSLNRRGFLRLCVVAAGGVVVAACQQSLQDIATATQAIPTGTPLPRAKINLTGTDQDVWIWSKPVQVKVSGECEKAVVEVDGTPFEAQPELEAETFVAEVKFSPGENHVSATCVQPDGVEIRSNMLNYT